MNKEIHPLIECLPLSKVAKEHLTRLEFYEIISDPVILVNSDFSINEARKNFWTFRGQGEEYSLTDKDLKVFYQAVIEARCEYLRAHYSGKKMIFYTWYDEMSGNLSFSLIDVKAKRLPFACSLRLVENLEKILNNYFKDIAQDLSSEEEPNIPERDLPFPKVLKMKENKPFILEVWSIILP